MMEDMGPPRIRQLLPVLLLALLLLGGAAWLLLGGEGTGRTGDAGPAGDSGVGAGPEEGGAGRKASADGTAAAPAAEEGGLVTGVLVLPRGPDRAPPEARLEVLREGLPVAAATSGSGAFSLPYPREPGDAAPFRLRAAAAGRSPVVVELPAPRADAGEIRLYAGLVYAGRAVDARGAPQEGITLHLLVDGMEAAASEPTGADGGFRIPIPPQTRIQGFFQEEDAAGWAGPPSLEPRAPGRLFVPSRASAEGLAGGHDVVLEERPVRIGLRFTDEATGRPVIGAAVSLWASPELFSLGPQAPADAGRTDEEGVYQPRWPLALKWAGIRIAAPDGRVLWTVLDRSFAEGTVPRELVLPSKPLELDVVCRRGGSGEPVPGAFVVLLGNAGYNFSGLSDALGRLSFAFFESDTFDPGPLCISAWTAAWTDGPGCPRLEAGGSAAMGQAGFRELAYTLDTAEPLVLPLGGEEATGIWISLRGEGAGMSARPAMVTASLEKTDPALQGWQFLISAFKGPCPSADGGALWWAYDYSREVFRGTPGPFPGKPREERITVHLRTVEGLTVTVRATVEELVAARSSLRPLVFDLRPPDAMTRTVRVVDREGRPAPGALVAVLRDDAPPGWPPRETERVAADSGGRAVLQTLDPAGKCRVLAWSPADGGCGILGGLSEDAAEAAWTIRLEPPREFRLRIRMHDGSEPRRPFLSLVPLGGMLPQLWNQRIEGGEASLPDVAIPGYTVHATAMDGKGRYWSFAGPAAEVAGREIVLGPTPASGR